MESVPSLFDLDDALAKQWKDPRFVFSQKRKSAGAHAHSPKRTCANRDVGDAGDYSTKNGTAGDGIAEMREELSAFRNPTKEDRKREEKGTATASGGIWRAPRRGPRGDARYMLPNNAIALGNSITARWDQARKIEDFGTALVVVALLLVIASHQASEDDVRKARVALAHLMGVVSDQVRKAEEMIARGLFAKAKRQALCSVLGERHDCSDTGCKRKYFISYRCKNRYCPVCGPRIFRELFAKYVALRPVADRLRAKDGNVVAKLDFTTKNLERMPTRDEIRQFNESIKRFCRSLERELNLCRREDRGERPYGLIYCDEFGGEANTNLHAHGMYVGPKIPRSWLGKGGKFSELWKKACEGTAFEGSFIISIKLAASFEAGLAHCLKYAGKFLSKDPARLADLELAFHGVRRVHALAAFYNTKMLGAEAASGENAHVCPECGAALIRVGGLCPIDTLKKVGCCDLEEAHRAAGRKKVFARGSPDG